MSYNVLEELAKEYYEYIKEYFVRTNVRFNKLDNGGYEGEIVYKTIKGAISSICQ